MSIGADLPPMPVQCPVCRRFEGAAGLHEVEAKAIAEPTFKVVVCDQCYKRLALRGTMRVMVNGRAWCIGLPAHRPIPSHA